MKLRFTEDEKNILKMYRRESRLETISLLMKSQRFIEDKEILELTKKVLTKLQLMNNQYFNQIDTFIDFSTCLDEKDFSYEG